MCEHPVDSDEQACEYNVLHYHALAEHTKRFDNDRLFNTLAKDCSIWKTTNAIAPVHFLAYMQVPPRHIILKNYLPHTQMEKFLDRVTPELIAHVAEKRAARHSKKRKNTNIDDIMGIKKLISDNQAQSESELVSNYKNPDFLEVFCKRSYAVNFKKALELYHVHRYHVSIMSGETLEQHPMPGIKKCLVLAQSKIYNLRFVVDVPGFFFIFIF